MTTRPAETLFVGSSELASLMRALDWPSTVVGPSDRWPQSVRAIIRMMLTSRYAMWMGWGPDLTFFYNDAYARMTLGAKHPWALGRRADQVWAEIWPDIGPRIQHVLKTGEATWDEGLLLFLERSGFSEETYHTFSYSPVHDDDGRVVGMFCVVTEDTTRILGERRLGLLQDLGVRLASSQTTEDVWSAVEASLQIDARDLPFTLAYTLGDARSTATLAASTNVPSDHPMHRQTIALDDEYWPIHRVLDASKGDLVIELPASAAPPPGLWHRAPTHALLLPIMQQGQNRPAGVFIAGLNPFRPLDAEYRSFLSLVVGQMAASLSSAQAYVAERRRAETLAELDHAKTTFFSNVSHELRTPLTLILGPVTDALNRGERVLKGDALDYIYRNGLRLRRLVNSLLDFSRIEAGRLVASYEAVDLGRYTSELAAAFRSAIEHAGLRFIVDCPSGNEPVYLDRDMWEKIVLNLVSNAFKFTFEGEISVRVRQDGEWARLEVRDTGAGIPADSLPRIFDRFHRVESVVGRTHEGTGIGLALVQELVKVQGGAIEVSSAVGHGSTFTVSLPAGAAHVPGDRVKAQPVPASTAIGALAFVEEARRWLPHPSVQANVDVDLDMPVAKAHPSITDQDVHLVLADDNADMRAYLTNLLGSRWHVRTASDGREALALIREHATDLVITDVMMPALDGFGLLRELRADERTRFIPVMMLSARAGDESRIEGLEAGADDYLIKPFSGRELVARVEANLRLAQAARERIELLARERDAKREAELQKEDLYSLLMLAPTPIVVLRGRNYVIELANPSACEIWGRQPEEVAGRPMIEAMPELVGQPVAALLDGVFESGKPYAGVEAPVSFDRRGDGTLETRYINYVYTPLRNARGDVDGVLAVGSDVTSQVVARKQIGDLREAAESANRAKDEFLAMLGHELRNPLAPILTALQLMKLRGGDAVKRERAVIERQVTHLVALVDDLLDVSRITRGKIELRRESIECADVVARAIEMASPLLEQQRHDLRVDVPHTGLAVSADSRRLAQVVANLITNAAKYTEPGGTISILGQVEAEDVVLRIRDTGIGIDADMLPKIFDLFAQESQALDRSRGGLGLGLAIVRSLVELHGGSVSASSPGKKKGSEFTVRLPHLSAPAPIGPAQSQDPVFLPLSSSGVRVLVVDDNPDAALMLAEMLDAFGYVTRTVHDGPSALRMVEAFVPDIAIFDIGLPIMDGYELAVRFRTDPRLSRTRLIAITGYGQIQDLRRSSDAGFVAHLIKPVDLDQLRGTLESVEAPASDN